MSLAANLAVFIASVSLLAVAGHALVKSLLKIASFLRVKAYVLAFIVMAFATSIPELFVGISSGLQKIPELSLGNVIGSNIADLTLVLGVTLLLTRKLRITEPRIRKDAWLVLGVAALPFAMFYDGALGFLDGLVLVSVFFIYMIYLVSKRANRIKIKDSVGRWQFLGYILLFTGALVGLFYAAKFVVSSAAGLSAALNLPLLLIGLILIALGTSLPELVFETASVLKGFPQIALGDVLGSVVMNSTLVLGITALLTTITTAVPLLLTSVILMLSALFVFLAFAQQRTITWPAGIALIMLYILFIFIELTAKGIIA